MKKNQLKLVWLSVLLVLLLLSACSDEIEPVFPTSTASSSSAATATIAASSTTTAVPTTPATTTVATTSQPVTTQPATTVAATTQAATTVAATTAVPTTPVAQPSTPAAGTNEPAKLQNVVYLKENKLRAYNLESGRSFDLTEDLNVFRYTVSPDNKKVAFLINDNQTIGLGLVVLNGTKVSNIVVLDTKLGEIVPSTEDNPFAGMYLRAFSLAFSPDSATLAYTKTNPNGPSFESWGTNVKPTEVWLTDLRGINHRFVANNEKNFMYKLSYSPDGERLGFIRTDHFPSDVSGNSAIWSVHKDGSKLSLLADGAKLGRLGNPAPSPDEPGLITSFAWDSPMSVSFIVGIGSLWVHDLSNAKDRLLVDVDSRAIGEPIYDPVSHRYAFTRHQGIYTIGTLNAAATPILVTSKTNKLLSFYDNTVMFLTDANTVALQSVNDDGSLVSVVLGLKALHKADATVIQALPGNGSWIVSWEQDNSEKSSIAVYSGDGSLLTTQPLQVLGNEFIRLGPDLFLVSDYGKNLQLLDLSAKPVIKTIDTGEVYYYES